MMHICWCDDGTVSITCLCPIGRDHSDEEFYDPPEVRIPVTDEIDLVFDPTQNPSAR